MATRSGSRPKRRSTPCYRRNLLAALDEPLDDLDDDDDDLRTPGSQSSEGSSPSRAGSKSGHDSAAGTAPGGSVNPFALRDSTTGGHEYPPDAALEGDASSPFDPAPNSSIDSSYAASAVNPAASEKTGPGTLPPHTIWLDPSAGPPPPPSEPRPGPSTPRAGGVDQAASPEPRDRRPVRSRPCRGIVGLGEHRGAAHAARRRRRSRAGACRARSLFGSDRLRRLDGHPPSRAARRRLRYGRFRDRGRIVGGDFSASVATCARRPCSGSAANCRSSGATPARR